MNTKVLISKSRPQKVVVLRQGWRIFLTTQARAPHKPTVTGKWDNPTVSNMMSLCHMIARCVVLPVCQNPLCRFPKCPTAKLAVKYLETIVKDWKNKKVSSLTLKSHQTRCLTRLLAVGGGPERMKHCHRKGPLSDTHIMSNGRGIQRRNSDGKLHALDDWY